MRRKSVCFRFWLWKMTGILIALSVLFLNASGYRATGCLNANEAYDAMYSTVFDLIVSDIMMPGIDGFEFAKTVRSLNENIPILFMTARDDFSSKQRGYRIGVDDYMVKPVDEEEMLLRIKALLRRAQMIHDRKQTVGDTVMECDSLTVTVSGESMILPQKEFMLLYKMAAYPGKIFTRQQLMDEIWGYDSDSDTHTVDVHIGRLRERFRDNRDFKIVTIRGVGYKLSLIHI